MFGLSRTERYFDGFEQALSFIGDNPLAARERFEINPPVRVHLYLSHIIIYIFGGRQIDVLRVRHGSEDWQD
ncbi:type II toxin-antitoxin system RelE/ParE family toxin [Brevundimonas kwangchunensis]